MTTKFNSVRALVNVLNEDLEDVPEAFSGLVRRSDVYEQKLVAFIIKASDVIHQQTKRPRCKNHFRNVIATMYDAHLPMVGQTRTIQNTTRLHFAP